MNTYIYASIQTYYDDAGRYHTKVYRSDNNGDSVLTTTGSGCTYKDAVQDAVCAERRRVRCERESRRYVG